MSSFRVVLGHMPLSLRPVGSLLWQLRRNIFNLPGFESQKYTIKKRINHPSDILFKVVSNVADYSKFVPYCTNSFVEEVDASKLPVRGGLTVGFQEFNEKFVCRLKCEEKPNEPKLVEAESLSDNLFHHLKMQWYIHNDPQRKNASKMVLHLDYRFSNPLYNSVSALFASKITEIMVKAFSQRAGEVRNQMQTKSSI